MLYAAFLLLCHLSVIPCHLSVMGTQTAAGACQPMMFAVHARLKPASMRAQRHARTNNDSGLAAQACRAQHVTQLPPAMKACPRQSAVRRSQAACRSPSPCARPAATAQAWRTSLALTRNFLLCSEARVTYPSAQEAEIVCRSLDVDREVRALTALCTLGP